MEKTNSLEKFLADNRADMLADLTPLVKSLQLDMQNDIDGYTDYGCDEPSIDIRLCIDLLDSNHPYGFIFRTGLVDYDVYHSQYCAASSVTLDTDANELLEDLINQLWD